MITTSKIVANSAERQKIFIKTVDYVVDVM
jgi:hypothetical protein